MLANNGPVNEGSPVTLTFSNQFDPSSVDTADGFHYDYASTESALTSSYASASTSASGQLTLNTFGPHTVWGRILDKDGGYTDYSTTVSVINVAPSNVTISGMPATAPEGPSITLTGNFTDPGSADTWTYDWTITDNGAPYTGPVGYSSFVGPTHVTGGTTYNPTFTFTPDDNGVYQVTLKVTDNGGLSATSSRREHRKH